MTNSFPYLAAALAISPLAALADSHGPVSSTIEFGPCTEFIGATFIPEDTARQIVPAEFALDLQDFGATAVVRTINCAAITITAEDGSTEEGGQHVFYQLGVRVQPLDLDPHPLLEGAAEITENHIYSFATVTNFAPLAEAFTRAGIAGVTHSEDIAFVTGDDNTTGCDLVPVAGFITKPAALGLTFAGRVRDLGLEPEDSCTFGPDDVTVSERAVWYSTGPFGLAMSDTAVPNSQRLLFNGDPTTFQPLPVRYAPLGVTMQQIGGAEPMPFSFTASGTLEWGEVFTTLRPITEAR